MPLEMPLPSRPNPEQPHGDGTLEVNNSASIETRIGEEYRTDVSLEYLLGLAEQGDWQRFDAIVDQIADDYVWFNWTVKGIKESAIDVRDLAISILEKTKIVLEKNQQEALRGVMNADENMHLRRKAAIALFIKGDRSKDVEAQLREAKENDQELSAQVAKLLETR